MNQKTIYHEGIVNLPDDVYNKPFLFWYDKEKPSTIIYSSSNFIFFSPSEDEITYTMEDIIRLNVADFILGPNSESPIGDINSQS